ncbi:MAG: glucose 1-dehydrogenase [Rhizobiaceae bacterium]|nr:glucose 1-dehydrogenase [Rhizobiaceae bacterium]
MMLAGKVALVTGAGSGIGRAIALKLAGAGARIVVTDAVAERTVEVAGEIASAGGTALAFRLDITDQQNIDEVRSALEAQAAAPDIVVNNAGWNRAEPFLSNTPDLWRRVIDINFLGHVMVTRAFLDRMIVAGRGGKIVNISSDAGRVGSSGETVYAGAKGAVIAFTKSLAREMARHRINVNCVCPGPTDTPQARTNAPSLNEALAKAIPFRRFADPAEIAGAVLFFSSDEANFVTGQVMSVSGGLTMNG